MESKVRGIKVGKIWVKVHKIVIFKWASNKMATPLLNYIVRWTRYIDCQLEKEMASHSHKLAWKIPWMEEPGGLQSMESQVRHD